ncbi:MAG: hypothetical protein EBU93_04505 [Chlamydiae bacterium]|nr:hypothetical protein [Chlamydiota bacterium]
MRFFIFNLMHKVSFKLIFFVKNVCPQMNTIIFSLSDQIDNVKEKLTDFEYKTLVETIGEIHAQVRDKPLCQTIREQSSHLVHEFDNEDYGSSDFEDSEYEVVPVRGSDAWFNLPISLQAKHSGMNEDTFMDWNFDHLTEAEVMWCKANTSKIPSYLTDHPLLNNDDNCKLNFCVVN